VNGDSEWLEPSFEHRPEEDLAQGWSYVALRNVGAWGSGGTPSKSRAQYWEGGSVPWVSPKDMKVSHISDAQDHITKYAVTSGAAGLVPSGTVLFVVRGMILAHSFPVALTTREVAFNQDMRSITPFPGVFPPYLLRAMQNEGMRILFVVREATHGTLRLESPTLHQWPMPLAPAAEQRRIVDRVEQLLARVNFVRDRLARIQLLLKRVRQAVLAAACSGELTREWQEINTSSPSARLADVVSALRPSKRAATEWAELPESWLWAPIEKLLLDEAALSYGILKPGRFLPSGVPMVRVMDIDDTGGIKLSQVVRVAADVAAPYGRTRLKPGDVLITVMATVGRAAVVPPKLRDANVNRAVAVLRLNQAFVKPEYMSLVLRSPYFQSVFAAEKLGSAQARINISDLRDFTVPIPPLPEQEAILAAVERISLLLASVESCVRTASVRAGKLPQAILSKAFSGDLVPTEAELARAEGRTYETAEQLLERVRREREKGEGNGQGTVRPSKKRRRVA
jgi:type I restriction enzyme, S subunit